MLPRGAGASGHERRPPGEDDMGETSGRREFLKTVSAAGVAVAAAPELGLAAGPQAVVALVGCAHIHTPGFVKLLASRPDVRVKWAWDPDPARVAVRAPELEAQAASLDQIFADPEVKAVVICSETNRHPELVTAAAKARKHMFVEKPLGITAADSRAMAEAIEKAGVLFTTGYFMRTDPKHLFLKEQVASGAFGTITRASAWNCHSGSLGGWFDEKPGQPAESWRWMADPKVAGVGAFGDLGTHSLDILIWILGDVASVNAELKSVTRRYGDVDETGTAMIRFESGASGTLTAGWVDVENPVTLQIAGTEGHAVVFNDKLYFESKKVPGSKIGEPWPLLPVGPKAPLHQFVDAVLGAAGQPLVKPREAAERVAVMEAMYQSARARQWTAVTRA
jgi:predicted dehydrogenase